MDRRKAIAVAAAITMSLTSGVLAAGANLGAFGFGGGAGAVGAKRNAVVAAPPANQGATAKASGERERGEGAYSEQQRANNATSARGEQNG